MTKFRKINQEVDAVQVTAADYNGHDFDGSPFSDWPFWLSEAISRRQITISLANSTDYAEWAIHHDSGVMVAGPGDWIVSDNGYIYRQLDEVFRQEFEEVK